MAERLMRWLFLTVLLLEVVYVAVVVAGAVVLGAVFPDLPGYSVSGPSQSLVLVLVAAALLLVLVAACGWWSLAGFTPPSAWQDVHLYWLPVALVAVPFVGGLRPLAADALGLLLMAYLATAVFEEGLWRGVILGLLRPTGLLRAVRISSIVFGFGHLARRIPDKTTLVREVTAFTHDRNAQQSGIDWRFTTPDARIKLQRLYPAILP